MQQYCFGFGNVVVVFFFIKKHINQTKKSITIILVLFVNHSGNETIDIWINSLNMLYPRENLIKFWMNQKQNLLNENEINEKK